MSITNRIFFLLVLQLTFSGCELNDNVSNDRIRLDDNFSENFGAAVSRDFIGQVVDTDNHPIQSVTIKIGTNSVQTDVNGVFIINGASVYEKFAYITAKKSGYIDGSRAMVPTSGKNNVKIMLLPNSPLQTIQSGQASEVSIYSGTKVVFDGAFQDENGAIYSGDVQVSMFHLTPSDENIDKLMPGMLYAQTQDNEEAVLETFGMLNVELRGSAGQKLNIASGHTAEITIRIDDSQIATAPNSIPLWHFDEVKGYWKEDGTATKVGNKYVGEVSHFSWWNCDTFSSVVSLTVTVVDANGNPLSNVGVGLTVNATNFNSYILNTGDNGQVSGLIPANQSISLNAYSNACTNGNIIFSSVIGPFSTNTTLPNIVIDTNGSVLNSTIVGTLLSCNDVIINNGYVLLFMNNISNIYPVTNGNFSISRLYCSTNTEFQLRGIDFENNQFSESINYNFTPSITQIGNLPICNDTDEFITYRIDENPAVIIKNNLYFSVNQSNLIQISGMNNFKNLDVTGVAGGTGTNALLTYSISGTDFTQNLFNYNSDINYVVNSLGNIGEQVDITFHGSYTDSAGNHTVTGLIHVLRDN